MSVKLEKKPYLSCFFKCKMKEEKKVCEPCPHYKICKKMMDNHILIICLDCGKEFLQDKDYYLENNYSKTGCCFTCMKIEDYVGLVGEF